MRKYLPVLAILTVTTLACNGGGFFETFTATPMPLPTLVATNLDPNYQPGGSTAIPPTLAPSTTLPPLSEEAILILSPGPQSQLTSPITVSGIANPTFENTLLVQMLDENGLELGSGQATLQASPGQRGPFEGRVEFASPETQQVGTLVITDISARDGHVVHLASVPVLLLPAGNTADLQPASSHPEDIVIELPGSGQVVGGGMVHVSGFSVPYFEQTLTVAVLDANGVVVGTSMVTIQAGAGQAGRFEADVPYSVTGEQPGAVQVYPTSARDGSLIHLSSVEVTLRP